jgi:hypothetical protein
MNQFSISAFACSLALAALSLTGCGKGKDEPTPATTGTVALEFEQTVGTDPLVLSTRTYNNASGEQFKVTAFRQYISNIKFTKADGSSYAVPESYYLLDAAVPASTRMSIADVPVGDYTGITFTVGVDSTRNVSGAQKGFLDPNYGMFWTWNSGYIYTKLEGTSPQAAKPAGVAEGGLTFHIGGFQSPYNTIRTVSPAFPSGVKLLVRNDHSPEVHLNANVAKMFVATAGNNNTSTISFASLSNTMGGRNSVTVANNIAAGMFSVEHIHAN